ncbi:MAG TPA: CPBP family intramembrane metalloprotease [Woeseiaceae bacterium]|nr:CPBP family intramembrane metalloprotease [Woeseiaceae bacterium]
MTGPPTLDLPRKSFVAVLLVLLCTLIFEAWWVIGSADRFYSQAHALNIAKLVSLPVLVLLILIILRDQKHFLKRLFARQGLTVRLVLTGIAIGIIARILAVSERVARLSFGVLVSPETTAEIAPNYIFACPPAAVVITGAFVWLLFIPFAEEFVHRGVILSAFAKRGPWVAVLVSALIFGLCHSPASSLWAFLFGVVLGIQYWNAGALWFPIITHATYDGLGLVHGVCGMLVWNPATSELPLLGPGILAGFVALACAVTIFFLVSKKWVGLCQSNPNRNPNQNSRQA